MHVQPVQAILITCGDKRFAHQSGFSENGIRKATGLIDVHFYEDRYAGGAAVVMRGASHREFVVDELATYINGPITDRQVDEGPVSEVIVIGTIHRSCGGCKSMIGSLFGTSDELVAMREILLNDFSPLIDEVRSKTALHIRGLGILLDKNGAVIDTPFNLERIDERVMSTTG